MPPELAIAQPSQPVVATPGAESQAPKPAESAKTRADNKLDFLLGINEPTADEIEDTQIGNDMVDQGVGLAGLSSKEANAVDGQAQAKQPKPEPEVPQQPEAQEEGQEPKKKQYKVGGKIYELTDEEADRWVQKGINHELRNRDTANQQRQIQAQQQQLAQKEEEILGLYESLKNPETFFKMAEQLHGRDKLRAATEGFLRPIIERELLPPEQQQALSLEDENKSLKAQIQSFQQQQEQAQIAQATQHWQQEYQKQIADGLNLLDLPVGQDYGFLAGEMVNWMQRGLARGIEYTPQQLAGLVKQDNILRGKALTNHYAQRIETAKKANNLDEVVKCGEQLVEMLGENVMYAIAKYHLAKHRPLPQPKQVLDAPKVKVAQEEAKEGKPYMTEEEFAKERRRRVALMEQGIDPGVW